MKSNNTFGSVIEALATPSNMTDIIFFSRGRGRGHAIRDLTIASEVLAIKHDVSLSFASYATGLNVLLDAGQCAHDLDLPERNYFASTVTKAIELIGALKPRLVVAQEEPAALLAASLCGVRALYTTNWFSETLKDKYQALDYAHKILFMEKPGVFPVPTEMIKRIRYCGPVLRSMKFDLEAANVLRSKMGLSVDSSLIVVLPGSPRESREPIWDLTISAFLKLKRKRKHLIWVAGDDYDLLRGRVPSDGNITVVNTVANIDALVTASQVIISKGTYNITKEASALGRWSISLSHSHNRIDDYYAHCTATNIPLLVRHTTSSALAARLVLLIERAHVLPLNQELLSGMGARKMAQSVLEYL